MGGVVVSHKTLVSAPVPIGIGIRGLGLGLDNIGNWLTHRMEKFSLKFKVGHKICNILEYMYLMMYLLYSCLGLYLLCW